MVLPIVIPMFEEKKGFGEGWISMKSLGGNEEQSALLLLDLQKRSKRVE